MVASRHPLEDEVVALRLRVARFTAAEPRSRRELELRCVEQLERIELLEDTVRRMIQRDAELTAENARLRGAPSSGKRLRAVG